MQVFCGIDWAEDHYDVALVDQAGNVLTERRIDDDAIGYQLLLAILAEHGDDQVEPIPVAIETPRGLVVAGLLALDDRCTRSIRCPWRATANGTVWRGPSPIASMPNCWPTFCAPTGPRIAHCQPIRS